MPKFLASYFGFCYLVCREEIPRRRWYPVVKTIWSIALVVGVSGILLHQILEAAFPRSLALAWAITALAVMILALLAVINFARTFYFRTVDEAREEWARRSRAVEVLSELIARGQVLVNRCERQMYEEDAKLEDDITRWHRAAASNILYEAKLDESYRDGFYKHSDSGERTPPLNECYSWVETRVAILREFRQEFEQPPQQLLPRGVNQAASGARGLLE
jgi:hypothetical protein